MIRVGHQVNELVAVGGETGRQHNSIGWLHGPGAGARTARVWLRLIAKAHRRRDFTRKPLFARARRGVPVRSDFDGELVAVNGKTKALFKRARILVEEFEIYVKARGVNLNAIRRSSGWAHLIVGDIGAQTIIVRFVGAAKTEQKNGENSSRDDTHGHGTPFFVKEPVVTLHLFEK